MFSLEQINFFKEQGYLVIEKFFNKKEIYTLIENHPALF